MVLEGRVGVIVSGYLIQAFVYSVYFQFQYHAFELGLVNNNISFQFTDICLFLFSFFDRNSPNILFKFNCLPVIPTLML